MNKKRYATLTILGYFGVMLITVFMSNIILNLIGGVSLRGVDIDSTNIIIKLINQIIPTLFLLYCMKKYYNWSDMGFSKINKKWTIFFLPYLIVITCMIVKFIIEVHINVESISLYTYFILGCTLIGTIMAGFSEEVIFRGILLNCFCTEKKFIRPMIISSIGFSIAHISTVFMGVSIIEAIVRVIQSSLLGFSFVGLAMKMKNILPMVLFHIMWNFIILASHILDINLSIAAGRCNIVNIIMAIIIWSIIILEQIKIKRYAI